MRLVGHRGEYLEVRCCCQPQKVLGWLPLLKGPPFAGQECWWRIAPARASYVDRKVRLLPAVDLTLDVREVAVPLEDCNVTELRLAFYSDDTPIEALRQVPGFVECR